MQRKFLPFMKGLGLAAVLACLSSVTYAQDADISKMGHFKLRKHLAENGYKTATGQLVKVGDTLYLGKGTMPDRRFAYIYQSQVSPLSATSLDGSSKAYLNSNAAGRKAVVKAFMTSGMRKGDYSIFTVAGVGEPVNYWIELEGALEAGEIKFSK